MIMNQDLAHLLRRVSENKTICENSDYMHIVCLLYELNCTYKLFYMYVGSN